MYNIHFYQYKYFKDKILKISNLIFSFSSLCCILCIGQIIFILAPFSIWKKPISIDCRCTRPGIWFRCKEGTDKNSPNCKKMVENTKEFNNKLYNFARKLINTITGIPKLVQCIYIPEDSLSIGKIGQIDVPDELIDPKC